MSAPTQFTRKPYTGSCHCGNIKYIVYLSLPTLPYPKTTQTDFRKASGHRFYKCNCTVCHKAGPLHLRLVDPPNDFMVITPKDPFAPGSGFKPYIPAGCEGSWPFCEHCGVRPFAARGDGYTAEVELPTALLQRLNSRTLNGTTGEIAAKEGETTRVSVWRPSKDWREATDDEDDEGNETANYLTVNGLTLDAHNENLDLRELHEKGYLAYMQTLEWVGMDYEDRPYFGGAY